MLFLHLILDVNKRSIGEKSMYTLAEDKFYELCDKIDEITTSDFQYDYIPQIQELKVLKVEEHLDIHLPYLLYLSNDPFGTPESSELAKYIKDLLSKHLELV